MKTMKKMELIKEEYVTMETVRLLQRVGFPVELFQAPTNEFAPYITQAVAMRWLREEHQWPLDIVSVPNKMTVDKDGTGHGSDYEYVVVHTTLHHFKSYEAAAEASIKAACEYLIENRCEEYTSVD